MSALTVTSKGQITLRRELLDHLGLVPGQQVQVDKLADGVLALHVKKQADMEDFIGCLPLPSKAISIEHMNRVIADAWATMTMKPPARYPLDDSAI